MDDTPREFRQFVHDELMRRSPAERIAMASRMHESARAMVLASLPSGLSDSERRRQLFRRFYSRDYPNDAARRAAEAL
jgi:hypothetical protein